MIKVKIITSVCKSLDVKHETDIWVNRDKAYILMDGAEATTVWELEREISKLKRQSENRLKGLNYWKNKATTL